MKNIAIEFTNISKRYFIGERSFKTLREDIERFIMKIAGHRRDNTKVIWALKNISFKIFKGESVGLVGHNGSGKTTIFKIISRVTFPTKGKFFIDGRIGSLIDLNAGFHPDLTGLENIYLNAVIRGMKRKDIKKRIGEILEFAEIERFKDTPIKHYSSGMRVRLGFSVAIYCPFDILLIDEVLSVGDVDFQNKCLEKISEFQKMNKTILFVSHDMEKVKKVCSRRICLEQGEIINELKSTTRKDITS